MLDSCLEYLCDRMNQSIKTVFDLSDDVVVVSPPHSHGSGSVDTENRVLLFISNLEKDSFSKANPMNGIQPQQRTVVVNKPLFLSMSIVMAANFGGKHYSDGLKVLSHLLAFVHRHPLLNKQNSPDLPTTIEQLSMEMLDIPEREISHMWSMLGSNYLPSSVYKVRVAIPNSEAILAQAGSLGQIYNSVGNKEN